MIFAANHHSHLDTPLLLTSIPEPWRHKVFVARGGRLLLQHPRHLGGRRRSPSAPSRSSDRRSSRRSADQAAELIDDGWSMLIFPEGGRCPDGWGQPFRGGAAYLVQPLRRAGRARPPRGHRPDPPQGRQAPDAGRTSGSPSARRCGPATARARPAFAERIERAVAELADEATTDWWHARRRAARRHDPALTGPDARVVAARLGPRRPHASVAGQDAASLARSSESRCVGALLDQAEAASAAMRRLGVRQVDTNSVRWAGKTCSLSSTGRAVGGRR